MSRSERPVESAGLPKLETGLAGFDTISDGGLPLHRATLIAGTAGSAKTVFATQFLVAGITERDEPGVFVTFEDTPEDIRENMRGFGWDIAKWEAEGKWAFVDAAHRSEDHPVVIGSFDLGALLARLESAIERVGAKRVSMDSVNALFSLYREHGLLRAELHRIITALKRIGVTTVFSGERTADYGAITRFGIEEFVADNVIILRNILEEEKRRRTIEILKFRGTTHQRGEFPFTVDPRHGVIVIPLSAMELTQRSSTVRLSSGVPELDEMSGGGYFRDSIILLSGATGTGKTLTAMHFIDAGAKNGERSVLFAFEESREQLLRNAASWGVDLEGLENADLLRIVPFYPHAMPMEDHLLRMRTTISEFEPKRVVVDSLSALERTTTMRTFREFVINLTSFIKQREVAGLFTATATSIMGGTSITEKHVSTLTDTILLLRYVEIGGEMHRGVLVLKMRGSRHDSSIRRFTIDGDGMHIHAPFRNLNGIIAGRPMRFDAGSDGDEVMSW